MMQQQQQLALEERENENYQKQFLLIEHQLDVDSLIFLKRMLNEK